MRDGGDFIDDGKAAHYCESCADRLDRDEVSRGICARCAAQDDRELMADYWDDLNDNLSEPTP